MRKRGYQALRSHVVADAEDWDRPGCRPNRRGNLLTATTDHVGGRLHQLCHRGGSLLRARPGIPPVDGQVLAFDKSRLVELIKERRPLRRLGAMPPTKSRCGRFACSVV